jgi:hypothetical protein
LHDVHFAFDKSTLTKTAQDTLNVAVAYLKSHTDARIEVQGHTDSIGSDAYNQGLSERRANSVKAYLQSQGIAESRIATKGFGESKPIADNGTKDGRASETAGERTKSPVSACSPGILFGRTVGAVVRAASSRLSARTENVYVALSLCTPLALDLLLAYRTTPPEVLPC